MAQTTIKEVSLQAGVSISTVSRVLNKSGSTSEETRKKVMQAVKQLKFKPNSMARALATQKTGGIGVVVNSLSSPFFSELLEGIEAVVEEHGMHLLVSNGRADSTRESECIQYLDQRADAVIGFFEALSDHELIEYSENNNVVVIGRNIVDLSPNCIYLDNEYGGYIATQFLIDSGHSKIAHISGPLQLPDSRARLQGYRQAISDANLPYDERLVYEGGFLEASGQTAVERLLKRDLDFTAIFIANDQMAAGALKALQLNNVSVPDEISLIGYDDIIIARYLSPTLTTVKQPLLEMGKAAARVAIAQIENREEEVRCKFEPSLVKRHSVKSVL